MMAACSMVFCICNVILPLHPDALMKNCIMLRRPDSRSALYSSIQSSTIC